MARPKQKDLPGMSDRKLTDLSDAAYDYAKIRDERMDLSQQESQLKQRLLTLMKKHKMKEYVYEDVEIRVVAEEETVRVRIRKAKEEESEEGEE